MQDIYIKATDLQDAWFQGIWNSLDYGKRFTIDKGSFAGSVRLELDYVNIKIMNPTRYEDGIPIIPKIPEWCDVTPPVDKQYILDYLPYIMTNERKPNEDYTYGERMWGDGKSPNQIQHIIDTYKKYGYRNNQMVIQIARPEDILLEDPPCLRHIDTRIQDDLLHFYIYFRSWDLWAGLPANLAGIAVLHDYMCNMIGVNPGYFICSSKGLHIYDYAERLAKIRCAKD